MQNYYKVLGTNREAVERIKGEMDQDDYIKEKYIDAKRKLNIKMEAIIMSSMPEKLEELDEIRKLCDRAYEALATKKLRDEYNQVLEIQEKIEQENYERNKDLQTRFKSFKNTYREVKERIIDTDDKVASFKNRYKPKVKKTAYDILNILPETLESRSDKVNDAIIENKKENFLQNLFALLERTNDPIERGRIATKISEIKRNYELIKDAKGRREYDEYLRREQKEKNHAKKMKEIESKYSHIAECNPDMIKTRKNSQGKESKLVIRKAEEDTKEQFFPDSENRNLRIKKTAMIGFQSSMGIKKYMYEYVVKRTINGEDLSDIIYTPISIHQLTLNRMRIPKEFDRIFFDCVINELFSEETILGARYNEGYIGDIIKNTMGKYEITLNKESLNKEEQEMLSAVAIYRQNEKQKRER